METPDDDRRRFAAQLRARDFAGSAIRLTVATLVGSAIAIALCVFFT